MKTVFFMLSLFIFGAIQAQNTTVKVKVDHFKNDKGQLMLAMYTQDNFLTPNTPYKKMLPIEDGEVEATFSDVPEGDYSVAVFQDENGNYQLDRNSQGIPVEAYGFSNNPELHRQPEFSETKFKVGKKPVEIHIKMIQWVE